MAFIAPKITQPIIPKTKFYPDKNISFDGGLDLADVEFNLPDNKTNKCLNVWFVDGELDKRWGQEYLNEYETPDGVIHSSYKYLYKGNIIKHCGKKLYSQTTLGILTELFTVNDDESRLFKYNDNIYLKQIGLYVQYDGTTANEVVPYIPTVVINRTPSGGGDLNEDYNRLGAGFKNSFSSDGTSTNYVLTDTDLDATEVTIVSNGVDLVENTDFTVNRTAGTITFGVAQTGGTNNVIVTAYKTNQEDIDSILNCLAVKPFGGQNDNRLFFGNNGTGFYYWTGISELGVDPTYFPLSNYNIVGLSDENITGFAKQNNSLMVIKEREVYGVDYTFDGTQGIFNSYPVHDSMGCDCPRSIQTINNNTVFLSSEFGVCVIQSTNVGNQRNVFPVSRNVDPRLLKEANIKEATSIDFDGKYWLNIDDKIYLWDYFLSPYYDSGNPDDNASRLSWWYFDNIQAGSWTIDGDDLYYGSRKDGKTVKFINVYDNTQYYDFGLGYDCVYRYPYRLIGAGIYEFTIKNGIIGVRGDRKTSYTVTYFTNDEINGEEDIEPIEVGSFAWDNFSWAAFTWGVMGPLYLWALRPALKNIQYFGVEFSNSEGGKSMNIISMQWEYTIKKQIK